MNRYVSWRKAWPNTVMPGISVCWSPQYRVYYGSYFYPRPVNWVEFVEPLAFNSPIREIIHPDGAWFSWMALIRLNFRVLFDSPRKVGIW
jgi:hypothetical protein